MKTTSVADPRRERRKTDEKWRTALTCIEPNKILVRGYPLDEVMGRLTFGEAIYLLFMGEVPSPGIAAHAEEERERQTPMRQIDPKDHTYDGPSERRLPERRK